MDPRGPEFERRAADWLSAGEAERRILEACAPLPCEMVPLLEGVGRALAEDVSADAPLPPWDNAAVDGYAVRGTEVAGASRTTPVSLQVRGAVRAGGAPGPELHSGEAARIMTGARVPAGADSVVRVEDTDAEVRPGRVLIFHDRDRGRNVRAGGQDARPGERVLARGQAIHAGTVGLLAALGHGQVLVRRRPTVAIVTTGDELTELGSHRDRSAGGGLPDSNGPMLAACVAAAGAVARVLGPVPDDRPSLREAFVNAGSADALVTVGGASMGEADLVKRALDDLGFRADFWRVRMRPGSPFSFGSLPAAGRNQPVFGLPGNPASAFVTFELFVRPFLLRLAGHTRVFRRHIRCVAGEELRGGELTLFLRVRLEGEGDAPIARTTGPQVSGLVRGLATTQGLAIVPEGRGVAAGAPVDVILLDPEAGPAPSSPLDRLGARR